MSSNETYWFRIEGVHVKGLTQGLTLSDAILRRMMALWLPQMFGDAEMTAALLDP